jgi:hypothetical protein
MTSPSRSSSPRPLLAPPRTSEGGGGCRRLYHWPPPWRSPPPCRSSSVPTGRNAVTLRPAIPPRGGDGQRACDIARGAGSRGW